MADVVSRPTGPLDAVNRGGRTVRIEFRRPGGLPALAEGMRGMASMIQAMDVAMCAVEKTRRLWTTCPSAP